MRSIVLPLSLITTFLSGCVTNNNTRVSELGTQMGAVTQSNVKNLQTQGVSIKKVTPEEGYSLGAVPIGNAKPGLAGRGEKYGFSGKVTPLIVWNSVGSANSKTGKQEVASSVTAFENN